MDNCFLFTKHIDDASCFCLKLSPDGSVLNPPEQRSFSEIKELQKESKTIVIESSANASILDIELPWLSERKARAAIPYALEDKLAQPVEELHFAFDKLRYQNNRYLITVIDKQRLNYLMQVLDTNHIDFDLITLDWFALDPEQLCVSEANLLVNQDDFKGSLSGTLATLYLKQHPGIQPLLFQDSQMTVESSEVRSEEQSYTWIAQKILKSKPLNLCQGDIQHGNTSDWIKKGYKLSGILCVTWLLSLLIVNALTLNTLNKETGKIDQQIADIYRQFFPGAKQIISPKFRIKQLLSNNHQDGESRLLFLLNEFAKVMKKSSIVIEQLHYQNKILSATVVSSDFVNLEKFENKLKKAQLKVNQTEASTREQQVIATLELM